MIKAIQVEYENRWKSEFNTWAEVKQAGWVFEALDYENCVIMSRKGYINRFRNTLAVRAEEGRNTKRVTR